MPKYVFTCPDCKSEATRYTPSTTEQVGCKCGKQMQRQLPNTAPAEVRETIDTYTNVSWKDNQQALIAKRKEDHYWKVEVPRLVQKYSLETCLEQKWLVYNERGELVINKPPSER